MIRVSKSNPRSDISVLITIVLSRTFESTNGLSWLRNCSLFLIQRFSFLPTGIRSSAVFNLKAIKNSGSKCRVLLHPDSVGRELVQCQHILHSTAFRKTDLRNHSFPKICCILGFILTAHGSQQFLIVRYILQCIVGNFNEPTRNTPSRQIKIFYKSKSSSKSPLFYRPRAQSLSHNSQK